MAYLSIGGRGVRRAIVSALLLLTVCPLVLAMLGGAYLNHPDGRTGAPGEGTCQGCHGSYQLNYGDGYVMLAGLPESYKASTLYTLNATVYSYDMDRWCFELTVRAAVPNHPVGSFSCVDKRGTTVSEDCRYIKTSRYGCGDAVNGTRCWQFQWTSPSRTDSDLTFYGVGMGEDGGGTDGDYVYTCMMTVKAPPRVPEMPAGLLAEAGDRHVVLTWYMPQTNPTGCGDELYRIYWTDEPTGGLSLLGEVNGTCTYVHSGLTNGRSYRYQVSGVNREGEGLLSELAMCAPNPVASEVRQLGADLGSGGSVQLSWQPPTSWGSGTGGRYTVLRGEAPWSMTEVARAVDCPSYLDSKLPCRNVTIYYRVVPTTTVGDGRSALLSIKVPPGPPDGPAGITATARTGKIELAWAPPADDGGDAVRLYRVYRTVAGGTPQLLADCLTECAYNDTTCMYGATYAYTVTAANGAGEGTMSASVESQLAQPASDAPTVGTSLRGIPFPMVGAMGAILIIGALMVGRLSYVARRNGRYPQ